MAMAEDHLRSLGISEEAWDGGRFGFGEDVEAQKHKSVYTEVERRDGSWLVIRLERRPDPISESERGFTIRESPSEPASERAGVNQTENSA